MPGWNSGLDLDQITKARVDGPPLTNENYGPSAQTLVTPTPAGRNSVPYDNRRVCHGNTNCTPICPIQAKYDAAYALHKALATRIRVDVMYQTVVDVVGSVDAANKVTGLHYLTYDSIAVPATGGRTGEGTAVGKYYVLAASAIEKREDPAEFPDRSRLHGRKQQRTRSDVILMDHPCYLIWRMMPEGTHAYGYREPISTSRRSSVTARRSIPGRTARPGVLKSATKAGIGPLPIPTRAVSTGSTAATTGGLNPRSPRSPAATTSSPS